MTDYASGYMRGVTEATTSSISLEYLFELGIKQASMKAAYLPKVHKAFGMTSSKMKAYDSGWLDGVRDVFANFAKGEVTIDIFSENFIPIKVIESIIKKSEKDQTNKILDKIKASESKDSDYDKHRKYPPYPPYTTPPQKPMNPPHTMPNESVKPYAHDEERKRQAKEKKYYDYLNKNKKK